MSSYAVIDPSKDKLFTQFVKLASLYHVPDHVLDASEDDLVPTSSDGDTSRLYALPRTRQFPIHTKKAAAMSAMYFDALTPEAKKAVELIGVEDKIKKALNVFGESWPVKMAVKQATAIPEDSFLINQTNGDQDVKLFPVRNSAELKVACHYYMNNRDSIPSQFREEMGKNLLKKLARLDEREIFELKELQLDETKIREVKKQAQLDTGNFYVPKDELVTRLRKAANFFNLRKEPERAAVFSSFEEKASDCDEFVPGQLVLEIEKATKTAAALVGPMAFNKITEVDFDNYYDDLLPLSNSSVLSKSRLSEVKKATLVESLGDDILDATKLWVDKDKLYQKIESLDSHSADRFLQNLKRANYVQVVELDNSDSANVLKKAEWELLANANV